MARKSQDLKRIQARRTEIQERMSLVETELEQLRSEDLELASAERVLIRLAEDEFSASGVATANFVGKAVVDDGAAEAIDHTMTIGDMALQVLQVTPAGLTSNEILAAIRDQWLPALKRTSLSPPLSRLKTRGEIQLEGDRWKVVSKNGEAPL